MVRIAERVSDLVLEFGGSLSGEHGDGIVRGVFTEKMFGPQLYQSFREFKRVFDPQGIMNPGKIVDCPPLAENLRFSPTWKPMQLETYFDFSMDGGIAEHAEMCNGQGACRQTFGGQMCPSYMATRDEEHSTRGRANALRTVFSGLVPHTEFTGKRLHEVLSLCLECKGCKFECPSSVDMAKLKYEFLGHYHAEHGFSMREKLFGNVHRLNPIGNRLAPVLNLAARLPGAGLAQRMVGIHPKRRLPKFASQTFSSWLRLHKRHAPKAESPRGRVVLFNDTYMEGNYPNVGIATTRLLERLGYSVETAPRWCCGRAMMSKGMLPKAIEHARHNIDVLFPYAEQGIPSWARSRPAC